MLEKPKTPCFQCPLYQNGQGFIEAEGIGSLPLLLVGESAGYNEQLQGLPFRPNAEAGSILQTILGKGKIIRNSLVIDNMIRCRPPQDKLLNTPYEHKAINLCSTFLDSTVKKFHPKVILALGALPFKHLTGLAGYKLNLSNARGYVYPSIRYDNVLILPTYHPSFIRRGNAHLMGVLLNDLMKAVYIAQGKYIEGLNYIVNPLEDETLRKNYNVKPTVEEALYFLKQIEENPLLSISYDIETEKSHGKEEDELDEYGTSITQIQFSTSMYSGIAFPYIEPFISIAKRILATSNPKCGHNVWDFDDPILLAHGFTINGRIDDTMWMQHHFQADIPIGLQYTSSFYGFPFAWKHLSGTHLEFYGIADVTSVQYIMQELPKKMKERNLWEGYNKYVYNLKPILVSMQDRGLPINKEKQDSFRISLEKRQEEIINELKDFIPQDLERLNKENGYVRDPKEVKQAKLNYMLEKGTSNAIAPEEWITEKTGFVLKEFVLGSTFTKEEEALIKMGVTFPEKESRIEKRWVKILSFNPSSPEQVSNFIKINGHEELAKKLTVKLSKELLKEGEEGEKSEKKNLSTSKDLLKKLSEKTGNIAYKLIVEYKELTKMKGTYIDGYKTSPTDNRIHTTYTFRPASGQLSSRSPNIQNYPVHSSLAETFKETIEAKEGHLLVSLDYRGFHNKMMGFLAMDEAYLRVASLDTHSFVTGHVVGYPQMNECLDWDDSTLIKFLGEIKKLYKKLRDDQIKHVVHGINFGLGEDGCYKRYMEDFTPSIEEVLKGKKKKYEGEALAKLQEQAGKKKVKEVYTIVKSLFPKLFEWQKRTIVEADMKGYIQTPFGARRWFFAASQMKYDKYGKILQVIKGEQAEEALAFPVSNNSHYHMRETMLIIHEKGLDEKYNMINMIHDSLVFEPRIEHLQEMIHNIVPIMERRSTILKNSLMKDGFFCNVDGKVGKNMKDVEDIKI